MLRRIRKIFIALAGLLIVAPSCTKTDISFVDNETGNDPAVTYIDNEKIEMATYAVDSFNTTGHGVLAVGHHADPDFGTMTASAYTGIVLPATNPVNNQTISFDSLVVLIAPNGSYYGDTLQPVTIRVHRLLESIVNTNDEDSNFYNTRTLAYDPVPLGQLQTIVRPYRATALSIRMPDVLGADLLQKLKDNSTEVQSQENFVRYLKGLCFTSDTTQTNTVYYFAPPAGAGLLRLYYKLHGTITHQQYIDFSLNATRQFNNLFYHRTGTNLTVLTPKKTLLKSSSLTGNRSYLHNNMASTIKISFPNLLALKELHPYIRVLKAQLIIRPTPGTYNYPYTLPRELNLYQSDAGNNLLTIFTDGTTPLSGDLHIDALYGTDTYYTYDITSFISSLISAGRFFDSDLMLVPPAGFSDSKTERLVVNDQTIGNGIQLKLYVLGI